MKKLISILITLSIALGVFMLPTAVSAESVTAKTLMQYKYENLTFAKEESAEYECKVTGNDGGFIKVDANNEGENYWLTVRTQKPTGKVKPQITITDKKDGSVVKAFKFTVTPAKKVAMKDVKLNVKTKKVVMVKNPYYRDYKLYYNKKLLKRNSVLIDGEKAYYTFKGLKKGTTTVKAKIDGKVYGSFKVTVGDFKTSVKKSYKKSTIKYNKHVDSINFIEGGSVNLADAIKDYHSDAKYTVKIKNKKVAKKNTVKKSKEFPQHDVICSLKPGKTTADVYEKRTKGKKTKIGTIKLTVKKVKDSEVVANNIGQDNDGLFYEFFVCPGDKIDLKKIITTRYINGYSTKKKFTESDYSISLEVGPDDTLKINEDGNIEVLGFGSDHGMNKVSYTIKFADGSKLSGSGSFDIVDEDFF